MPLLGPHPCPTSAPTKPTSCWMITKFTKQQVSAIHLPAPVRAGAWHGPPPGRGKRPPGSRRDREGCRHSGRARPGPVMRSFGQLPARKRTTVARGGGWSVTIGAGIALIIIGAILKWGVTWKPANLDLGAIGIILMAGGAAVLILAIVFTVRRSRRTAGAQVYEERRYTEPPPPPTGP